jgi:hypothetical protein
VLGLFFRAVYPENLIFRISPPPRLDQRPRSPLRFLHPLSQRRSSGAPTPLSYHNLRAIILRLRTLVHICTIVSAQNIIFNLGGTSVREDFETTVANDAKAARNPPHHNEREWSEA